MNLALDVRPSPTDLTACSRCADPVTLQHSWKVNGGGRICMGCVTEAVEAYQLAAAADRELPF
ncbi:MULTISPECIES: hypothetical protein [unclassified Nonomuraea]|uniref:hypothetical protein n=1 Tax=unclassified Nonomuraea TaxID=2593643 RepID=UPI0033C40D21